ncbi:unnamed protein product [Peronospora belbahrii]|uniref:Proteasome assembly chaperone 1 n=1 Tax=Peronospora belbahrii TaxID=622444 RepID=A0AAU9KZC6_9STRA|nr:unnamed protein product [Peronospora belbahrii]CAH0516115.1 unnamed protein product [Peronospora belbahrii]
MALALRFPEEGEFSSRACDFSALDAPNVVPSTAIFRWSRAVRKLLGTHVHDAVEVKTLVIAMPGAAQQFVQQLTASWTVVGTLLTTDQVLQSCKLHNVPTLGVMLSKTGLNVSDKENCLVLLVDQEVPTTATWEWLNKLRSHIDAQDIVCLDSQLSTIYTDKYVDEQVGTKLRMLATSTVTEEWKQQTPVRPLEVPQFVAGIPAALLTHGELRKRRVCVFVSLRDVSATSFDVMQSFMPLIASSSSVLGMLERPTSFQPTEKFTHQNGAVGVLYS